MTPSRERWLRQATWASISTAVGLLVMKTAAYFATDSVAVLASLADSLMDAMASAVNFWAVRVSFRPADDIHSFGHGKAEALSGLGQSLLVAGSGLWLLYESFMRLISPRPMTQLGWGMGVMGIAVIATVVLLAFLDKAIAATGSTAIKADALHYRTDVLSNLAAFAALALGYWGILWVDGLVGLAIALFVLKSALDIARESIGLLMDAQLPGELQAEIFHTVRGIAGILGAHDLRTRRSGATVFVQVHIEVPDELSLLEAHALADKAEAAIMKLVPEAEVFIHVDPSSVVPQELKQVPDFAQGSRGPPKA
ncbi:MAG: cation diffusion facilitator family transporter [Cystobacterineae bacterium]|nr:cation diffusion facilitator family transporter [Cystobacterineae bacterium]